MSKERVHIKELEKQLLAPAELIAKLTEKIEPLKEEPSGFDGLFSCPYLQSGYLRLNNHLITL
jgi:hypothetical protein